MSLALSQVSSLTGEGRGVGDVEGAAKMVEDHTGFLCFQLEAEMQWSNIVIDHFIICDFWLSFFCSLILRKEKYYHLYFSTFSPNDLKSYHRIKIIPQTSKSPSYLRIFPLWHSPDVSRRLSTRNKGKFPPARRRLRQCTRQGPTFRFDFAVMTEHCKQVISTHGGEVTEYMLLLIGWSVATE